MVGESTRAGRKESVRFEQGRKNQPAAQNGGKEDEYRYGGRTLDGFGCSGTWELAA